MDGATLGVTMGSRTQLGTTEKKDTTFHCIQDMVTNGTIKLVKNHPSGMLPDVFTKPVTPTLLHQMVQTMWFTKET